MSSVATVDEAVIRRIFREELSALLAPAELLTVADMARNIKKSDATVRAYLKSAKRYKEHGKYTLDDQQAVLGEMKKARKQYRIKNRTRK